MSNSSSTAHDQIQIAPHDERRQLLTARIKQQALSFGFDKVGIAEAAALTHEREHLEEWLGRGFNAEMKWMGSDADQIKRRTDPRELLSCARSVVVVALNYYTSHEHSGTPETGKISRYAWGSDYHDVVGAKLRELLEWIKAQWPEVEGKVCCDAQPMMDKAWAVRAGLGWIGKHSNLITRDYGSWVFLGELILNLDLEPDTKRTEDHCGSCTLCLDACPTGAIVEPRVVAADKCISYSTIELRSNELPVDVASNMDGWLYGCDTCQDVCPWNRFEKPTTEAAFEPRPDNVSPSLTEILDLTPDTYAARFRRSPIKRAKLTGLQRNARALQKQINRDRQDEQD